MRKLLLPVLLLTLFSCKINKYASDGDPLPDLKIPVDSVKLNPYGNAPLSALLKYTSNVTGHTKIVVQGLNGAGSSVTHEFTDNGTTHSIPIVGLYPAADNKVTVYLVDNNGKEIAEGIVNIQTGPLPANMPASITIDNADYGNMESGMNLVSSYSGYPNPPSTPFIMDNYGKIRWYLDFSKAPDLGALMYDCGIARLQNGNYYFGDITSDKVYEVDLLGKVVNSWSLPGYVFNHNVTEKPDGNLLVTVSQVGSKNTKGNPTIEDGVLELERTSGKMSGTGSSIPQSLYLVVI